MADSLRAQLVELIAAQLDGYATTAQMGRLELLLENSVEARQFYVDHLDTHACLVWERVSAVRTLLLEEGVGATIHHELDPPCLELRRHTQRPVKYVPRLVVLVASVALVACLVATAGRSLWHRASVPAKFTLAAKLTAMRDCDWGLDASHDTPSVGHQFRANDVIDIRSGVAQLTFANGATVHLEGPACFTVESSNWGLLERGRLLAQVPHRAIGFCVTTPTIEVVDLGTEFGVQTDTKGATEVQVLRGLVEVAAPESTRDRPSVKRKLVAGQSMESDARGLGAIVKGRNSERFSHLAQVIQQPDQAAENRIDVDFSANPGWVGADNTSDGNDYGYRAGTSVAGGTAGEVGGTFARNKSNESYYGDTHISQTLTMNDAFTASGRFNFHKIVDWNTTGDSGLFIGYFSASNAVDRQEFIGLRLQEDGSENSTHIRARLTLQLPSGNSADIDLDRMPVDGNYSFIFTYDPNPDLTQFPGSDGRMTMTVTGSGGYKSAAAINDVSSKGRISGAQFDAFGMGIARNLNSEDDANKHIDVFLDDVSYSGFREPRAEQNRQ